MKFKEIAVLITCHNRVQSTLGCLTNLFGQIGLGINYNIKVFLVDDGCTDGTGEEVRRNFPEVVIIKGDGNLYWNRGMHVAWQQATIAKEDFGAYLWLNDDTYLLEDGLLNMLNAANQTDFKSIICGSIHAPNAPEVLTYGGCRIIKSKSESNVPNGKLTIADLINGNCVLVPHEVFLKVGNLDWTFRHAIGDNEYSLRAKKKQIKSYSTGEFVGVCSKNDSLPKWCRPDVRIIERLKNLYSPLGLAEPFIFFRYNVKYFGILVALKDFTSTHLRVICPQLWLMNKN